MKKDITRRDFTRLTAAAFGGVVAGAVAGCNDTGSNGEGDNGATGEGGEETTEVTYDPAKHACRGLNECKGLGVVGENDCAGQGACSTVEQHVCGGRNECKFQGGCMENIVSNECAGEGGCHVPIEDPDMWAKAREVFEARMAEAGKEVGEAPAAATEEG